MKVNILNQTKVDILKIGGRRRAGETEERPPLSKTSRGVDGGARTHDLQIHNLAL